MANRGVAVALLVALCVPAVSAGITAGDVDDNINWAQYVRYADRARARDPTLPGLNLTDRITLRVQDDAGSPMPFEPVTLVGTAGATVSLVSGGDGIVRVFPGFDGLGAGTFRVQVGNGPASAVDPRELGTDRTATVTGPGRAEPAAAIDVMFTVDTTGSMGDELSYLKDELADIAGQVAAGHPRASLRFGLTVYRDEGDDYVVRTLGFTPDLATVQGWIEAQEADGGGDYEEAMEKALAASVGEGWRPGRTARILFLVADAPPHVEGYAEFLAAVREARRRGIHIEPVGASGVGRAAEAVLRAAAVVTQGRYVFLTDDSGIGDPHAEPHIACYVVTELRDLLVRIVASEASGTRVEPDPSSILRTMGSYDRGACLDEAQGEEPRGDAEAPAYAPGAGGLTQSPGVEVPLVAAGLAAMAFLVRGLRQKPHKP